jgi:hypothetical protein
VIGNKRVGAAFPAVSFARIGRALKAEFNIIMFLIAGDHSAGRVLNMKVLATASGTF